MSMFKSCSSEIGALLVNPRRNTNFGVSVSNGARVISSYGIFVEASNTLWWSEKLYLVVLCKAFYLFILLFSFYLFIKQL